MAEIYLAVMAKGNGSVIMALLNINGIGNNHQHRRK